jgi:hypothetical protein
MPGVAHRVTSLDVAHAFKSAKCVGLDTISNSMPMALGNAVVPAGSRCPPMTEGGLYQMRSKQNADIVEHISYSDQILKCVLLSRVVAIFDEDPNGYVN